MLTLQGGNRAIAIPHPGMLMFGLAIDNATAPGLRSLKNGAHRVYNHFSVWVYRRMRILGMRILQMRVVWEGMRN